MYRRRAVARTSRRATRETEARFDIGTPESYLDAVAWHLDGENYVHPTATIKDADIGEGVQIMADVAIENAAVDKSVIFPEAIIHGGELHRSIIDRDATIERLNLSRAVIGAHTRTSKYT